MRFVVVPPFLAPGANQTTYFHFCDFVKSSKFYEFAIWLGTEHEFWSRCFIATFVSGALVPTK